MKPRTTFRFLIAIVGSSLMAVSSASAQATSNTWDTNAAGNWTDPTNWVGNTNYAEGADNTATFGDFITADRIVTLNAGITIGNINASDTGSNYTISGANTLTLDRTSGTPTINVVTGRTLTISSNIDGNDGLNKTGLGILALSGTNNYTGTTTISQGTLNLGNSGSTGSLASTALALSGGTLSYTRTGTNTQNFSTTAINAGNSTVSTTVGTNTLGLGAITQSAGGTLNVGTTGTITTSNTNVNNILGSWAFRGTAGSTTYAKVSGSTIASLGYTGGADGTSAATAAALTTDATGNFSFTGGAGALGGNSFNTLRYTGATGAMTGAFTANGIMNAGAGTLTFSDAVTIGFTSELVVNAANNNITFSSAIGNNGSNASSFTKVGTGTVTLSGNNTYTGLTVVGAGILTVNHNNALGSSTGLNSHTILSGVTGNQNPRISVNSNITTAENITITGETENGSFVSPLIAGGSGATQGTYSGTITLAGSGAIRIGPAKWTGTITQSGTSHKLIFVGANTVSNAMTINGADLTVSNGTTTLNAVNGTGIGNTDIYADTAVTTLILGVTDALRTDGDMSYNGTNTMRLNLNGNNQTIRGLISSGSGTRTVNNDVSSTISTLTVGNGGGDYSFAGTIIDNTTGTGTVALTKTGTGNQTLTGTNTYTGGTQIDNGTLTLGHAADTLANTGAINVNGGTLSLGANSDTVGAVTLTSGSITGSTGVLTGSSYDVRSGSVSAILGGAGIALTKTTGGTVTLSGANTYTGTTTISAGKLHIANTAATSATGTGAVNLSGGNTTTLSGTGISTGLLTVTSASRIAAGNNISGTNGNFGAAGTLSLGTTGGMTLTSANLDFDLANVTTAGSGVNDLISTGGVLSLTGTEAFTFNLLNGSLDTSTAYTLISGASSYSFASGDITTWTTNFVNSSAYTATYTFSGNNLQVTFAAIPEPKAVLLGVLGVLLLFRRRR